MKKALLSVLVVVLLVGLAGCAQAVSGEVLQSEKERETSPDVSKTDTDILVEGNSTFAFELYQALKGEEGNLFYSPYSISLALAMTYAGAAGETEQQMADVLHFYLPQEQLHPAFSALEDLLEAQGNHKKCELHIANALWAQENYGFLGDYFDLIEHNYGGELHEVDFVHQRDQIIQTINDWVEEKTDNIEPTESKQEDNEQ